MKSQTICSALRSRKTSHLSAISMLRNSNSSILLLADAQVKAKIARVRRILIVSSTGSSSIHISTTRSIVLISMVRHLLWIIWKKRSSPFRQETLVRQLLWILSSMRSYQRKISSVLDTLFRNRPSHSHLSTRKMSLQTALVLSCDFHLEQIHPKPRTQGPSSLSGIFSETLEACMTC